MYLLFDIGGTKMRVGVSEDGEEIESVVSAPTPKNFDGGMAVLFALAENISKGKKIKVVVGGIAGVVDKKTGKLTHSPNLEGWIKKPFIARLKQEFHCPIFIENDAGLAGLGEANFGAGRSKKIVAYLTISTGIGGARIVDGKIDNKVFGFEPGGQIIDYKNNKMLEDLIGGASIIKQCHKKPEEINDSSFWDEKARILAYGLHNIIVAWSPEIIILGGGMMREKNGVSLARVQFHLKKISKTFPKLPILKKAELGEMSGLYGGLIILKNLKSQI